MNELWHQMEIHGEERRNVEKREKSFRVEYIVSN